MDQRKVDIDLQRPEVQSAATGDITAIVAGNGLSGGAQVVVLHQIQTNELTAVAVDVANDSTLIDADNGSKKESLADLATAMAGLGITATNGVLSITADIEGVTAGDGLSGGGTSGTVSLALDLNELTAATIDVANDSFAIIDAGDNSSKKEAIADFVSAIAGTNLTATNGVLSTTADITGVTAGNGLSGGVLQVHSLALDTSRNIYRVIPRWRYISRTHYSTADNTYDLGPQVKHGETYVDRSIR